MQSLDHTCKLAIEQSAACLLTCLPWLQGACQTSGQAIQARSAAQALQAALQHTQAPVSAAVHRQPAATAAEQLPEEQQRRIVAGRMVLHALSALSVRPNGSDTQRLCYELRSSGCVICCPCAAVSQRQSGWSYESEPHALSVSGDGG